MGEEERGALRMAMSATNGGNGGMRGLMDDEDDDELVMPPSLAPATAGESDGEQFAHAVAHPQPQLHVQAAQAQAQAQAAAHAQYMRARAATFSHGGHPHHGHSHSLSHSHPSSGIASPVSHHGHGHHPYAAAYHANPGPGGIPRPGSHGGLPSNVVGVGAPFHSAHPNHGPHGHILPFDNGADLILAGEPHLSSGPHTPNGSSTGGMVDLYSAAGMNVGGDFKNDWNSPIGAHGHGNPFAHHGGMMPPSAPHHVFGATNGGSFDDSASNHSSSTGTGPVSAHPISGDVAVNGETSPRSLNGGGSSPLSSGGRSRAGSMVGGDMMGMKGDLMGMGGMGRAE